MSGRVLAAAICDTDAADACGGQRVAVRAAEVEATARHGHPDAVFAGAVDREPHPLVAGQLPQCVASIEHSDGAMLGDHVGLLAAAHRSGAQAIEIHWNQHDAVRWHPAHVAFNESARHRPRRTRGHPHALKESGDRCEE
jgi:hypothetical protein